MEDENQEPPSSLVVDGVGMITRLNKAYAFLILSWSAMLMMPTAKAWPLIDILDLHGRFLFQESFKIGDLSAYACARSLTVRFSTARSRARRAPTSHPILNDSSAFTCCAPVINCRP